MTVEQVVMAFVFPVAVAIVVWAVTSRGKDRATIRQVAASTAKAAAEGKVSEGTVAAAIELADVATLQAHVAAMSSAFKEERESHREERESLNRRLDEAEKKQERNDQALRRATDVIDQMKVDQQRTHRELIDMYRRDQHHARVLQGLADWLAANLPKLKEVYPDLEPPPPLPPLPPLLVPEEGAENLPARRWYDDSGR